MGTAAMGKVIVAAKVENLDDLFSVRKGILPPDQVRSVEVADALVDTGATSLSMPKNLIDRLGLQKFRTRRARTANGLADFNVYGMVRLTVQGRDCHVEVTEIPDELPVLIGQVPLEILDWVVDSVGQRLVGNPAHGGEQMMDLF
jgi:predicted aspartyl protease